ncbi:hypothetical protein L3X38_043373 [Prunus dulcis]|uniref:Transposase MuDR plant domain-containing protein n=1 Tax=Prunus dulcis TaxID=3755 RepID=A0AAD4YL69_PRUDU|nr:hypothetical protein L3X38_043373 [Prunus dulcis]
MSFEAGKLPQGAEGLDPALWTAHHGGQLQDIGNGYNFYSSGSVVWVDNLNRDYMSPFDFDDFAKKLGYQERVGYYYRMPDGVNGLEKASNKEDIQNEIGPEEEEFDEYNSEDLRILDGNSSSDEEPNSVNRRRMKKKLPKFKQFRRETDIRTTEFHLGMVFANAKEFKEAVKWHFVNHCRSYKFKINDWYKVKAVCKAEPCPWSVYTSSMTCLTDIPLYMLKH